MPVLEDDRGKAMNPPFVEEREVPPVSQRSAITQCELVFQAESGGTFAATWGQRHMRAEIQRFRPVDDWNPRFRCPLSGDADSPVTVERALDILRTLIERHVALRTRFRLDATGGVVEQIVADAGRIGVDIVAEDDAEQFEQAFSAHLAASAGLRFDLERDLPLRMILGVSAGSAHVVGIVMSHVCLDGSGKTALREDLRRIASGQTLEPVAFDPIAAATEESGAPARARTERALAQMGPIIEAAADNPLRTPRHTPPVLMTRGARLATDSFKSAHDYLEHRLGLFTSGATTLVAAATALHRVLGAPRSVFKIECGNRWTPETMSYVGHRAQPIYVAAAGDADDLAAEIRAVDRAILRTATRCSPYDPDAMQALIERAGVDSWISFNDLRSLAAKPASNTAPPELDPAFLRHDEDARPTPLERHDARPIGVGSYRVQAMIHLGTYWGRLRLSLEADDGYLDDSEIAALLREIERTVIGLARTCHAGVGAPQRTSASVSESS